MIFHEPIPSLFHLKMEPQRDERGYFARTYSQALFKERALCTEFVEWSQSHNEKKHTLRGLHWQTPAEVKMVRCIRGSVFDVAVDLRPASTTFGQHYTATLSAENGESLYIPEGFAHGFQTLEDNTTMLYHISVPYAPQGAQGIRWNDPQLAINWPCAHDPVISERDKELPLFADLAFVQSDACQRS